MCEQSTTIVEIRGLADAVAAQDRRDLRVEAVVVPALALLGGLCLLGRGTHLGNRAIAGGRDGRGAGLLADFLLALLAALAAALPPAQPRNPARGQEDHRGQAEEDHACPGLRREHERAGELHHGRADPPDQQDRAGQIERQRQQRPGCGPDTAAESPAPPGEPGQDEPDAGQPDAEREPRDAVPGVHARLPRAASLRTLCWRRGSGVSIHRRTCPGGLRPPRRGAGRGAAWPQREGTSLRSRARSTSRSDAATTRPGRAGIGTRLGTATTLQPAASAEATPFGESSRATHDRGSAPSSEAASRYGSGAGLLVATSSAHTVAVKPTPSCSSTATMIGRSDDVTRACGSPAARTSASSSRAPGSMVRFRDISSDVMPSTSHRPTSSRLAGRSALASRYETVCDSEPPTRACWSAALHSPCSRAMTAHSASNQIGSESTSSPSMSNRTPCSVWLVADAAGSGPAGSVGWRSIVRC